MAVEKDYTRLGLFLLVSLIVALGTILFFVQSARDRPSLHFVTYTNQNVTGLTVGRAVRFKGVTVGRVDRVRIDAGTQMVEIGFELFNDTITELGGDVETIRRASEEFGDYAGLRVHVMGNPVTGEAYVLLDTPANPPPPIALDFEPDRPYVPSMRSPLERIGERLPELIARGETLLEAAEQIVIRLPVSLDKADGFFTNVERVMLDSQLPELSDEAREFFVTTSAEMREITDELETLLGENGTFTALVRKTEGIVDESKLPETSESLRTTLDQTSLAVDDLRRNLPAIREALIELRALARFIEEQPESVLYGPRSPEERQ